MEGLLDFVLRDILTRVGGVDRCVSEFIRVTNTVLPDRVYYRVVPELLSKGLALSAMQAGSEPSNCGRTGTPENVNPLLSSSGTTR